MSKATVTNPAVGHSRGKPRVIPSDVMSWHQLMTKDLSSWDGPLWY